MNMANQIGGMITASLTPLLGDKFGWNTGFYVAAGIAGLGAIAWLLVNPELTLSTSSRNSPI
jgi:ACS family glucarate transporter-like MFS transporter